MVACNNQKLNGTKRLYQKAQKDVSSQKATRHKEKSDYQKNKNDQPKLARKKADKTKTARNKVRTGHFPSLIHNEL